MPQRRKFVKYLALLLLAAVTAGFFFYLVTQYVCVDFRFYPRSALTLDLTQETLTTGQFDQLQKKLPGCDIVWNVPLSGGARSSDSEVIRVQSLSAEDVAALAYFPKLTQVDARQCTDYGPILEIVSAYPQIQVQYAVILGGESFAPDAREIEVRNVPGEELPRLDYLPQLQSLICAGGEIVDAQSLRDRCREAGVSFFIRAGNAVIPDSARQVEAEGVTSQQMHLFSLLPDLESLLLPDPQATVQELLWLRSRLETVKVDWTVTLCGVPCGSGDAELDLSQGEIDLEEIREKAAFFPEAKRLYLGFCGLDNETLAAFREEMRNTVKVVWQVQLGKKLTARTDDTSFMPVREHIYYFNDEEAYNLRYCEDMVAVDIGHMSIHNIEFVAFMPNLTYLILAHTQLNYIEPISSCKNLKFLELDWSPVRDLSPLVGCTALEDLNLGKTFASFDPITEMTWLKNLWVINCNPGVTYQMAQALPDTRVQGAGNATVASGWRQLPNYYAMRDALEMYYMSWG